MARLAVVTVSFNTMELTALLLWSLYRVLEANDVEIVVVDNGSTDGSRELLTSVAEARRCDLIVSPSNIGHGPGLNVGLRAPAAQRAQWVWVLDSDCVVARPDA